MNLHDKAHQLMDEATALHTSRTNRTDYEEVRYESIIHMWNCACTAVMEGESFRASALYSECMNRAEIYLRHYSPKQIEKRERLQKRIVKLEAQISQVRGLRKLVPWIRLWLTEQHSVSPPV